MGAREGRGTQRAMEVEPSSSGKTKRRTHLQRRCGLGSAARRWAAANHRAPCGSCRPSRRGRPGRWIVGWGSSCLPIRPSVRGGPCRRRRRRSHPFPACRQCNGPGRAAQGSATRPLDRRPPRPTCLGALKGPAARRALELLHGRSLLRRGCRRPCGAPAPSRAASRGEPRGPS